MPDLISNGGQKTASIVTQGNVTNGRKSIALASDALSSYDNGNFYRHDATEIRWTFEIVGSIDTSPTQDYFPNGRFVVGGDGNQVIW